METMTMRKKIFGDHDIYGNYDPLPMDLQGWASDSPVFSYIIKRYRPQTIIEVGSWKGRSAINMATICKSLGLQTEILCIDTWLASVEHWTHSDPNLPTSKLKNGRPIIYDQFLSNVINCHLTDYITPFPIDSINGALTLEKYGIKADFVYIDAGHEYDSVKADLLNYRRIVKEGGVLVGDDWFHPPIKQAVADSLEGVETFSRDKFIWRNV